MDDDARRQMLVRAKSSTRELRQNRSGKLLDYDDYSWWGTFIGKVGSCLTCVPIKRAASYLSRENVPEKEKVNEAIEKEQVLLLELPYNEKIAKNSGRPDNYVTTTKYTWYSFVPKSVALQFRRFANAFFLGIVLLSCVGTFAPQLFVVSFEPWGTLTVLSFVVFVTMLFEAIDDINRYKADKVMNNQLVTVLEKDGSETDRKWGSLRPGQVVRVMKGQEIPADLILVRTSFQETGLCYIETSGIDGETNLKIKSVSKEMRTFLQETGTPPAQISGVMSYEKPNSFLQFSGNFSPCNSQQFPVEFSSLLLRGSVLRNTAWIEGVIVYSGIETKLVLSSKDTPSKFSRIDTFINRMIGFVFLLYLAITLISDLLLVLWVPNTAGIWYFQGVDVIDTFDLPGWLAYFFTFCGLYANFVAIDMYFCLELVNFMHGWLLTQDEEMYHDETNTRAGVRTGSLVAEIGQVTHIFSDKTGTLTANEMRLVSASIGGRVYGFKPAASQEPENSPTSPPKVPVNELFKVVIDYDEDGNIQYNAEGPDEEALVKAAAGLGYVLVSTENNTMVVKRKDNNTEMRFKVLAINAFNSDRKRMSVVVEDPNGSVILLMKGADNVMLERCRPASENEIFITEEDMFAKADEHLNLFSSSGLRTLVVGVKNIPRQEFDAWFLEFQQARLAGAKRKEKLAEAAEKIEGNVELLGITAIEDALQQGVPETVKLIRDGGIKLWVLTGDKVQTAINIALSCNLLDSNMTILKLTEDYFESKKGDIDAPLSSDEKITLLKNSIKKTLHSLEEVVSAESGVPSSKETEQDLEAVQWSNDESDRLLNCGPENSNMEGNEIKEDDREWEAESLALVITGGVIELLLKSQKGDEEADHLLYELASRCHVVVACRVSPIQKALMVKLVTDNANRTDRNHKKEPPVTLAIGDGANDVAMIQEAKVGVGISGKEGLQAVNSADFSIAQFRFLRRLLFVHGRWNYYRTSTLVKYITYSWLVVGFILFFFMFYCMFSGQQIFYNSLYLTIYAWLANSVIVAIAWFERDIGHETALANPRSYQLGASNELLGYDQVLSMAGRALVHSGLLLIVFYSTDRAMGIEQLGAVMFSSLIMLMASRQFYLTGTIIWFTYVAYILMFILFLSLTSLLDVGESGVAFMFAGNAGRNLWAPAFWTSLTVIVLEYTYSGAKRVFWPKYTDILREIDRGYGDERQHQRHGIKDAIFVAEQTGRYLLIPAKIPAQKLKARLTRMENEESFVYSAGDRKCKEER